jgi:glycosyltransferase involved in cell wall biosynthesis
MTAAAPLDVSVVIAARDAAGTLPRQLDALAAQRTDCRWEVLVADNGSQDGTPEIARSHADALPDLRVLDASAQIGAGPARNAAASVARGEVLLFCDADDVVDTGWLEQMRGALAEHAVTAGRLEWAVLNDEVAQRSRALPQVDGLQHTEPLPWLPHASSSNLGIRTSLFRRLGGFDPAVRFLQDTDLCWRAQLAGADLAYVPDAVVHMRLRASLRGAWRQGRGTGMGERWLAARYGAVAAAHGARVASRSTTAARAARAAAAARGDVRHRLTRSWPWRIARRTSIVAGEVLRVRSRGDVAALSWSTGFGVGYALGGLPDPAPYPGPVVEIAVDAASRAG